MRINCVCEGNRKRAKDSSGRGAWMKRGRDVREGMRDVSHSMQGLFTSLQEVCHIKGRNTNSAQENNLHTTFPKCSRYNVSSSLLIQTKMQAGMLF